MITAEFEEKSYEAPLYNQLERGNADVFTPGQVLESTLGFDRGLFLTHAAFWQTLGYKTPLSGAALAYYDWPLPFGPLRPSAQLPRFKLNLFLQAKRPAYYQRTPRSLRTIPSMRAPMWSFRLTGHQQKLLQVLAEKTRGRAHVAYAAPAFHTNSALFTCTKRRTIVQNSTFPSVSVLTGHEAWYYRTPGAQGVANPNPESFEEPALLERIRGLSRESETYERGDIRWLDLLARNVIESASAAEGAGEGIAVHFFDELHTLERLSETYGLPRSLLAYAQINLFALRFDLSWLVLVDSEGVKNR